VKLILEINERVVGLEIKLDVSKYCSNNERSDFLGLWFNDDFLKTSCTLILDCKFRDRSDT